MMSTTMFIAARRVGIHGRCTAKNVRVSSRFRPPNGRLNANQNSAIETRCVDCAVKWPRWKSSRTIGFGEHHQERRRGDQQQVDLAHPDADARGASRSTSRLAAMRLSVGNSTVATATLNSPWGSM